MSVAMAFRDAWHKVLVYFALAEERDPYGADDFDDDEDDYDDRRDRSRRSAPEPAAPVRRIDRRRRSDEFDDIFSDDDAPVRSAHLRPVGGGGGGSRSGRSAVATPRRETQVHLVLPKSFNDAQQIADRFKDDVPVVINLQTSDTDLAKRLIDFASGLTYALDGGMQRIADKVFMLTPADVQISAEERAQLIEKGFFNQS